MKKRFVGGVILLVVVIIGVFLFVKNTGNEQVEENDKEESENTVEQVDYSFPPKKAEELLEEQKEMDNEIREESQDSTLEDPYIRVDPYDRSPLSALVIFDTKQDAKVSFTVKGKTADVNISHAYDSFREHHEIPITGLYPDAETDVTFLIKTEAGAQYEKTVSIETEALPDKIPAVEIKTADEDLMDSQHNTLNFAIPSSKYPYAFDKHGDIRWYGSMYNSHVLQQLTNGHILYLSKDDNGGPAYNRLFETDYLGRLYNAFEISEEAAESESEGGDATLIHHDMTELPSGNLLLTVNDGEGEFVEDTMIEMERDSGRVVKKIDLKDIFPPSAYVDYKEKDGKKDWFHQNSVVYDESDDSIIISGRNQDTVMKIDYETEEVRWILAAPEGWDEEMKKYLVEGTGENFEYTGGQHDATIMPDQDDDPDTIDLLIYDNNINITRGENAQSKMYSGAIQYRVNEKTKKAEMIWKYGEERGEDLFTAIIGSARYLPETGNRLIGFGHVNEGKQSNLVEVTNDDDASVAFEAKISGFPETAWSYRGVRRLIYTDTWENNY